jgi:predicted PurR-regulated permease PerM
MDYKSHKSKIIGILFILIISIILIFQINDLFLGIIMAFLLDHIVEILEDFGFNKYFAIFNTILFIFIASILIFFNLLPIVYNNLINIFNNLEILIHHEDNYFQWNLWFKTIDLKPIVIKIMNYIESYNNNFSNLDNNLFQIIKTSGIIANKFSFIINIFLGFSGTIFIARSLFNNLLLYCNNDIMNIIIECRQKIKKFLSHQLLISLFNGLYFCFIIKFFAIDGAYSIALMVFLTSFFIPSFGSLIGIVFSLIMMIVQQYTLLSMLIVLFLLFIAYILESYIFTPILICNELQINYLILLIGLLSTTKILGFKYLLFTIPIIIIIQSCFKWWKLK